jgi:cell division protein ZapA
MGSRRNVEVFILDKPYTVVGDTAEEVQQLAAYVDQRIREAIEQGHAQNPEKAAVLAALNIAEDLFRSRNEYEKLAEDVEARSRALLKAIPDN